jgi:hypothetical protein
MAALDEEVPCRDTDPLPNKDEDSNRDSPVAFTINFGFGDEDAESAKEKAKKLERFALRSSLRKPKSPRMTQSASPNNISNNNNNNGHTSSPSDSMHSKPKLNPDARGKTLVREKSNLSFRSYRAKSATTTTASSTANMCHEEQTVISTTPSAKSANRKDSSSSRYNSSRDPQILSSMRDHHTPSPCDHQSLARDHHQNLSSSHDHQSLSRDHQSLARDHKSLSRDRQNSSPRDHQSLSHEHQSLSHEHQSSSRDHQSSRDHRTSRDHPASADTRRRLTTTLSPEESKMISHFEKEMEAHSLEIVERSYEDEEFEVETESTPSETGTYTVGRDEEKKIKKETFEEKARFELESLVGDNQNRTNYVQDWATRHAGHHHPQHSHGAAGLEGLQHTRGVERGASAPTLRPSLIPSPTSPPPPSQLLGSGTSSSLSKSRRRLPPTPGGMSVSEVQSPESTEFSPSTDSPSPTQESDEGETNFMKHTQHLVNVMEARINQKTGSSHTSLKSATIVKKKATTTLSSRLVNGYGKMVASTYPV